MAEGLIDVITGGLGAGKTCVGVEMAMAHILQGGTVFTQVEVYADKIAAYIHSQGFTFDPDRLKFLKPGVSIQRLADHIQRGSSDQLVMILWDEASFDVNVKDRAKLEREFQDLCTLARKLDLWLVLVSQLFNDLDNQVRGRVQHLVVCRNLAKLRFLGFIPFPIPLMVRVWYDVAGFAKPHYSHTDFRFGPSIAFGCYNSKALLGPSAEKFGALAVAKSGKLQRVEQPAGSKMWPWLLFALCVSYFASL